MNVFLFPSLDRFFPRVCVCSLCVMHLFVVFLWLSLHNKLIIRTIGFSFDRNRLFFLLLLGFVVLWGFFFFFFNVSMTKPVLVCFFRERVMRRHFKFERWSMFCFVFLFFFQRKFSKNTTYKTIIDWLLSADQENCSSLIYFRMTLVRTKQVFMTQWPNDIDEKFTSTNGVCFSTRDKAKMSLIDQRREMNGNENTISERSVNEN